MKMKKLACFLILFAVLLLNVTAFAQEVIVIGDTSGNSNEVIEINEIDATPSSDVILMLPSPPAVSSFASGDVSAVPSGSIPVVVSGGAVPFINPSTGAVA